eukprot:scaffold4215_cov22-Cyclotella_meneghiniana.AAC.1
MCLISMANDGGLQAVLDASELVSQELIALSQQQKHHSNNTNTRSADRETIHDLAAKTNGLEVDDSKSLGMKRAASRSLSELSSSHEKKWKRLMLPRSYLSIRPPYHRKPTAMGHS